MGPLPGITYTFQRPDKAGPIENAMAVADDDYHCNAYLCRGYQYEDNENNVQPVKAGDVLTFHIDLIAGHRPGYSVSLRVSFFATYMTHLF